MLLISIAFVVLIACGEPARRPRVGPHLRGAHLLLHRQHGRAARRRRCARCASATCPCRASTIRASCRSAVRAPASSMGATLYVVLHAFASGGAAVTGVEAISNGVPAFKEPAWKNARTTLVIMGSLLGVMFLGLSVLAAQVHVAPYIAGTPTVISQIGELVYGRRHARAACSIYCCRPARCSSSCSRRTRASPTSLASRSFHAGDNFMPRQLTKRGHRLVFSNGIIFLAVAAIVLLIVTDAKVDRLIPLYAIGVFTSFTLSQAGMAKHHLTHQGARLALGTVRQRDRRAAVIPRPRDRRDHQVHARRVGDHRARADHGVAARAAQPPVRGRGRRARARRAEGGRGARSCAGTS